MVFVYLYPIFRGILHFHAILHLIWCKFTTMSFKITQLWVIVPYVLKLSHAYVTKTILIWRAAEMLCQKFVTGEKQSLCEGSLFAGKSPVYINFDRFA